ncbi:MAG: S1C family serine protease [Egibacteraceae bacterium]
MTRVLALCALCVLLLVACRQEAAQPPEEDDGPTAAVSDLEGVRAATVRIVAEGTFVDPEIGLQANTAGSGSGFIVDPSGIVVTNNHVVTGAALLEVYLDGEDEPRNGRVLGYSECSDLAVIKIEGEEDFPYLEWYDDTITTGLDVYTAGYPLGDPEFTLTRGIVSKASADGDTDWASVDSVIEHDATINPGNSGGPLVTDDAQVVAVNYAAATDANQYFAISSEDARPLLERLQAQENVHSIGINGQAVGDDAGLTGVWVAAVDSGSAAAEAGIEPGDIVTTMEGLTLGADGTMSDFCDILRSRTASDVLAVEVLRFETEEVLAGELNGDPLEARFSFAEELGDEAADPGEGGAPGYSDYVVISDDTDSISVEVPVEWSDVDGAPFTQDGAEFFDVRASSNLESFQTSWNTPGVIVTASQDLAQSGDEVAFLDRLSAGFDQPCTHSGRFPYEDALYTGQYDLFTECGGVGATYVIVGAVPEDRSSVIGVQIQVNDDRDFEALDRVLATFILN